MPTAAALPEPPPLATLAAEGDVALFLDFDGTLVELADSPDEIVVPPDLLRRIEALAKRVDGRLALVSGRAIVDIERHLGPVALCCAGSHGADVRAAGGQRLGDAAKVLPDGIARQVEDFAHANDLRYEEKSHGAALHSRGRPDQVEMAAAFLDDLAKGSELTVSHGKLVAEILHAGTDKGTAVKVFLQSAPFAGARPIFIGDDVTDEDGFAAVREAGGLAITVGERDSATADYGLADVAAVHHWLNL